MSERQDWFDAMRAKGHMPRVDEDGGLDIFAMSAEFHNGPSCEACGWNCCMHCEGIKDIPACDKPPLELEATEVGDERVMLIETFDLRDPCCPIVVVEPYGIVMEPRDRSSADAIVRFERAGGVILRGGTVTMPEEAVKPREIYTGRDRR